MARQVGKQVFYFEAGTQFIKATTYHEESDQMSILIVNDRTNACQSIWLTPQAATDLSQALFGWALSKKKPKRVASAKK